MANPRVRPHLSFYPEDIQGRGLSETRQSDKWLREMPDNELTPMVRLGKKDYYIHEPAMLRDGVPCMPVRWFTRAHGHEQVLYAKCWGMAVVDSDVGRGWCAVQRDDLEYPVSDFLKNFEDFRRDAPEYGLPDPSHIARQFACPPARTMFDRFDRSRGWLDRHTHRMDFHTTRGGQLLARASKRSSSVRFRDLGVLRRHLR